MPRRSAATTPDALISAFASRYANPETRHQYEAELSALFADTGRGHPRDLTEADVLAWCARPAANNSIRGRLSRTCTFLRWCVRSEECDGRLVEALMTRDNPLRQIPKLYGKLQGKNPPRWLTHEEAFGRLIGACQDGTEIGLRDEVLLRLGLAGMRAAEMINLWDNDLRLDSNPPLIVWVGKKRQPRQMVPGPALLAAVLELRRRTGASLERPIRPDDPVLSGEKTGGGVGRLSYGNPIRQTCSVQRIVKLRADQADLGRLSPHDLRRSAAGILHRTTTETGGHRFALLDIQKVLGHKDPATTMRSYLDPLDNGVLERASACLD